MLGERIRWRNLGCMRQPRIKAAPEEASAVYHCVSRTVNGERLFDDVAKEVFRKQLWQVATYCGVQIVTYAVLSNHFHILVRVPRLEEVSDAELLRRFEILYPRPTPYQLCRLDVVRAELSHDGPEAVAWRKRQLALMGDVSQFMKLLKQRFSIWFNKSHGRFGTLWAERFKSVLVECKDRVLQTMAAYIDLNAVRAGLTTDPKDYRFCGYAEAIAGNLLAQRGIRSIVGDRSWVEAHAQYREMIFGTGAGSRQGAASFPTHDLQSVIAAGGNLSLSAVLRCRLRYFSDGAVLGSRAFVASQLAAYRQRTGRRERTAPRSLPACTDWGDLATLRGLRLRAVR
jgi:REP-associated tyrosine transposase